MKLSGMLKNSLSKMEYLFATILYTSVNGNLN